MPGPVSSEGIQGLLINPEELSIIIPANPCIGALFANCQQPFEMPAVCRTSMHSVCPSHNHFIVSDAKTPTGSSQTD